MKNLIYCLLVLFSVPALAQKTLPVYIANPARVQDLPSLITTEANVSAISSAVSPALYNTATSSATVTATSVVNSQTLVTYKTTFFLPQQAMNLGKAMVAPEYEIWFDKKVKGAFVAGNNVLANIPTPYYGRWVFSLNAEQSRFYKFAGTIHSNQVLFLGSVGEVTDPWSSTAAVPSVGAVTSLTLNYYVNVFGSIITDDLKPAATFVYKSIGDSIEDAQGASVTADMPTYQLVKYLTEKGYFVRDDNSGSFRGSSTQQHLQLLDDGYYNNPANLYSVQLGTNDAAQGVPVATYAGNMMRLFRGLLVRNNNAIILAKAVPPVGASTARETLSVSYRAALGDSITAFNNARTLAGKPKKLFYVTGTGSAFNATDATNFSVDLVHPNSVGYAKLWTATKTFLDNNPSAWKLENTVNYALKQTSP